jgi:hypothetical protein
MKKAALPFPLLLVLFSCTITTAQNRKVANESADIGFNLRTSLNSYFDHDAGIMLGVGYRWSNRFSAAIEPTWIFYNGFNVDQDEKIFPKGIKIRTDIKYHFSKRKRRNADFFIAPEFHYKNVKTEREDEFGINCQNGQCPFFQHAIYTEVKKETGGLLKLGVLAPFPFARNDQLLLEFYSGLGMKIQKFAETDLPVGGSFVNPPVRNFTTNASSSIGHLPLIPVGLKVIFVL